MTPQQLSMRDLRKAGLICEGVEHWNSFTRTRKDLFHFADIIAFSDSHVVMLVQTTSFGNMLARIKKILENPLAKLWAQCSHRLIRVDGWKKEGSRWKVEHAWVDRQGCHRLVGGDVKRMDWGEGV